MESRKDAPDWLATPFVTVYVPACPHCRSESYERLKTMDNGDSTSTQRVVCRGCHKRYRIVLEPLPVSGEFTTWPCDDWDEGEKDHDNRS